MTTEPSPYAVCVCGHTKINHHTSGKHETACWVGWVETGSESGCDCETFRPAMLPSPADHESLASPSPAHDVPAAQLRERLAEVTALAQTQGENLNRHMKSISDLNADNHALRERLAQAERENERLRSEIDDSKLCKEGFWYCVAAENLVRERDSFRAEADRLREQVAALQSYADMAAGLLAEKQAYLDAWDEMVRTVKMSE